MDTLEYYRAFGGIRRDQIYHVVDGQLVHKEDTSVHNGVNKTELQEKDLESSTRVLLSREYCCIDPNNPVFLPLRGDVFKIGRGAKKTFINPAEQWELYKFMCACTDTIKQEK